jgi:hypothetical protein
MHKEGGGRPLGERGGDRRVIPSQPLAAQTGALCAGLLRRKGLGPSRASAEMLLERRFIPCAAAGNKRRAAQQTRSRGPASDGSPRAQHD